MLYLCFTNRDWKHLRQNTMKTYIWEMNNSFYISIISKYILVRISFSKCCLNTFSTTYQTLNCEKSFYSCFMYKIRYFGLYSNFITMAKLNKNYFQIFLLRTNIKFCIYLKLLVLQKLWLYIHMNLTSNKNMLFLENHAFYKKYLIAEGKWLEINFSKGL